MDGGSDLSAPWSDDQLGAWCEEVWPRLVRSLLPLCDGTYQAEDLAQEALSRAVARVDRSGEPVSLTWVTTVALNLARSRLRRLRVERRERPVEPPPSAGEPRVEWELVLAALRELPKRQRTAIGLRYLADLSVEQTAEVMGCSPATVKTHVRDGFASLRSSSELRGLISIDPTEGEVGEHGVGEEERHAAR